MKKNFLIRWMMITIIVSLAGIWPEIAAAQDAYTFFNLGTNYLRVGKPDKAIGELNNAITILKNSSPIPDEDKKKLAEAYNNLGLAYYEKKDYSTAQLKFWEAYLNNPSDTKILSNYALTFYVQGSYSSAINWYIMAINQSEGDEAYLADVYNNLGVCYANKPSPNFVEAEKNYSNAIDKTEEKNLDYTDAYYNRGNLFYNQGNDLKWQAKQSEAIIKFNQAISDYTVTINFYKNAKDLEGFPDAYHNAYYNRGLCKYDKGQYNEAIPDYDEAIKLNPGFMWAYYAKGYAHFMMDEYDKAFQEFAKVLNSELDSYARYGMGVVFAQKGQDAEALIYLNESCDLGNTWACDTLKDNYEDLGQL